MTTRYPKIQIWFHWLSLLLIALAYLSINLKGLGGIEWRNLMRQTHFTLGLLVWIVVFTRIGIRHALWKKRPEIIPPLSLWQEKLSHYLHILLYIVFLTLPILGILTVLNRGGNWTFLGITLIDAFPRSIWGSRFKEAHELLANIGYVLIAIHAIASLYHHYILKDNTLIRMMPSKKKK